MLQVGAAGSCGKGNHCGQYKEDEGGQHGLVRVLRDGEELSIASRLLQPGDVVVLRCGSVVPADGRVIAGEGMINQSSMTGESLPVRGDSLLYFSEGDELAAVIAIHDTIRQEAVDAIRELKAMGVREVVMLTGDGERTARAIAGQAGITSFVAQALPDNGLHALPQLRRIGHRLERRIGRNNTVIVAINSLLMAGGLAGIVPATVAAMLHNSSTVAISMASMRPMVRLEEQS